MSDHPFQRGPCCVSGCRFPSLELRPSHKCKFCKQIIHPVCALIDNGDGGNNSDDELQCPYDCTTKPPPNAADASSFDDKDTSDVQSKRSRKRYSNELKAMVLEDVKASKTLAEVSRRHNISDNTIRLWVRQKKQILTALKSRRGGMKSNPDNGLRRLTEALLEYIESNEDLHNGFDLTISPAQVAQKGLEIKEELLVQHHTVKPFLSRKEMAALTKFSASDSWAKQWIRKHNLKSLVLECVEEDDADEQHAQEIAAEKCEANTNDAEKVKGPHEGSNGNQQVKRKASEGSEGDESTSYAPPPKQTAQKRDEEKAIHKSDTLDDQRAAEIAGKLLQYGIELSRGGDAFQTLASDVINASHQVFLSLQKRKFAEKKHSARRRRTKRKEEHKLISTDEAAITALPMQINAEAELAEGDETGLRL